MTIPKLLMMASAPDRNPFTQTTFVWGSNANGELGLGNTTALSSPVQLGSKGEWKAINAVNEAAWSLMIKYNNTLWATGGNNVGQLGIGNTTNKSSPVQIGSNSNWASINSSAHMYCSAAITDDGKLFTWGANTHGSQGDGTTTTSSSPVQIGTLTNWLQVSSGLASSLAVKTDGTLWAWGWNHFGASGLGNTTSYSSPVQVGSLTNWAACFAARTASFGLKTDGTLWSWGQGNYGFLGHGDRTQLTSPVQIGSATNWTSFGTQGRYCGGAINSAGKLYTWGGINSSGQQGSGNTTGTSAPAQIGSLTNWGTVSQGLRSSGAVKTDGTRWVWGIGTSLGTGSVTNISSPVQLGSATDWVATNDLPGMKFGHNREM